MILCTPKHNCSCWWLPLNIQESMLIPSFLNSPEGRMLLSSAYNSLDERTQLSTAYNSLDERTQLKFPHCLQPLLTDGQTSLSRLPHLQNHLRYNSLQLVIASYYHCTCTPPPRLAAHNQWVTGWGYLCAAGQVGLHLPNITRRLGI